MSELTPITVSQLNRYIASKIKSDDKLTGILLRGEISNFTDHFKTGHWYFTLKDKDSGIKGIMFKWFNERMQFVPENGMSVIIYGDIQVFERDGIYQIYAKDIIPDGAGSLNLAFEQLKSKLNDEDLFDISHKRQIPEFPEKICILTAETGAALQDVLNILERRCPVVNVCVIPTLVQGTNAPLQICNSLRRAAKTKADIIILCRGGGSMEDLWAFNDETVARSVYASQIPVISAIGHETDFTICDFVADLRAPTPSAAAELAVCDKNTLLDALSCEKDRLYQLYNQNFSDKLNKLNLLQTKLTSKSPQSKISEATHKIKELESKINFAITRKLDVAKSKLEKSTDLLLAINPLSILSKGYSMTYHDDKIISDSSQVNVGDRIRIKFESTHIDAIVCEGNDNNDI